MLGKLLSMLGLSAPTATAAAQPPYAPYQSDAANTIYNLMFCDDAAAFAARPGFPPVRWQAILASAPADIPALRTLAESPAEEGRVRYMAYRRLREAGESVPGKVLLGVVVEMPLEGGLDSLAAYSEGGVRYVNQSGKIVVAEGVEGLVPLVQKLFAASAPVVAKTEPWSGARRAPPLQGNARLTFLVSDGLYFGEGPVPVLQRDPMAGPVIREATELLLAVVKAGSK